ncbi:hypothetical protein M409DRAFT_23556 [Zasmidium cellare ATCC 36951]|uniref:Uncharacterized protein n=1 Tax=Zasmidium cellare ATCC 36951 TaxID=1080233 RepID=A0A6A6CGT5_ZASCE|nr:uncharacterized protein M409DRAFT_23556 [Zasmidium cellare ATCC 36951]KAF2166365.1 hypothetical protein M409DRAFT_23556 [Zasmidium cellare ATCC 36951]
MAQSPDSDDRMDDRGRWLPPKKQESNILRRYPGPIQTVDLTFGHNGTETNRLTNEQAANAHQLPVYRACSLYSARGVFWTVDYHAIGKKIGDGKHDPNEEDDDDESESGEEDTEEYDDWAELTFGRVEGHQSLSYAGRHLLEKRLLAQRHDQDWVQHLIPDRYQSHITTRDRRSGGLVGDLSLLIGLVAMSVPVAKWLSILPQTIRNPRESERSWRICREQLDEVDRGSQWREQRGIIVTIYRHPHGSTADDLHAYEHGDFGPMFS